MSTSSMGNHQESQVTSVSKTPWHMWQNCQNNWLDSLSKYSTDAKAPRNWNLPGKFTDGWLIQWYPTDHKILIHFPQEILLEIPASIISSHDLKCICVTDAWGISGKYTREWDGDSPVCEVVCSFKWSYTFHSIIMKLNPSTSCWCTCRKFQQLHPKWTTSMRQISNKVPCHANQEFLPNFLTSFFTVLVCRILPVIFFSAVLSVMTALGHVACRRNNLLTDRLKNASVTGFQLLCFSLSILRFIRTAESQLGLGCACSPEVIDLCPPHWFFPLSLLPGLWVISNCGFLKDWIAHSFLHKEWEKALVDPKS